MKAIILAGGRATRLYPVTLYMPKQLMMINGYPAIYYIINHCKINGINNFVMCISDNGLKEHFYNALGNGSHLGTKLTFSVAPDYVGTAGRMLGASKFIKDQDFVVYYGDIITTFDLKRMIQFHNKLRKQNNCICTIAISSSKLLEFGVCSQMDGTSKVLEFKERPHMSEISRFKVNCGIAVCNKRILDHCKKNEDLFRHTLPRMIKKREFIASYDIQNSFYDIGTYANIEHILSALKKNPDLADLRGISK